MNNQQLTNESIESILIGRYKDRLKTVWTERNYYYDNPLYERTEILTKIKQLQKIKNGRTRI